MKKFLKNNKGSITTVVLVTVLFFVAILSTGYMVAATLRQGQLKSELVAKETYEKPLNNLEELADEINEEKMPSTAETTPYLPSSDFKKVPKTDLSTGLVIEDKDKNQYVWVEVPKNTTVYSTAGLNITNFTDDEYTKIENDLHTYTSTYRNETGYSDTWAADTANEGWLTSDEYTELKNNMLKSVYLNGGFYVGRYEAGIETNRTSSSSTNSDGKYDITGMPTPLSQADAYPYTYVTRTQAQKLAESVNSGNRASSLMFGVQWDLVLAFMSKDSSKISSDLTELTSDSTSIGNYSDNLWTITNTKAQYSGNYGSTFNACPNPFKKESRSGILLTTGADSSFSVQNIYDIAGNVWEWTLEKTSNEGYRCAVRGGRYDSTGSRIPAFRRYRYGTTNSYDSIGFRVSLW